MSVGFASVGMMLWCCLVAASSIGGRRPRGQRLPAMSTGFGLGLAAFMTLQFGATDLDPGVLDFDGSWQRDHFAAWVDVIAAALAGLLSARSGEGGRNSSARLMAVWLGATAASVAGHSTHLLTLIVALEIAALVGLTAQGRARRDRRAALLFTFSALLGAALIFGATADLHLAGMSGRVAKVFNQWGGSQRWLSILAEKGEVLPEGYRAQMRGRVISGMAPASLLLPGVLFLAVSVLGRLLAPGAFSAPGRAFARLVALVLLVRVFAAALHAPRMVNEPYGWVGPLGGVAMGWMCLGAWRSTRAKSLDLLNRAVGEVHLGLALLSVVLASNYYGHRALAEGPVSVTIELSWSQRAGDDALAAGLAVCTFAFLASALMWVLTHSRAEGEHSCLVGLASRSRADASALVSCLWLLTCVPLAAGFVPFLALLRSLVEHSSLRPYLPLVVICVAVASLACLALAARALWGEADTQSSTKLRARLVLPLAVAMCVVGVAPEGIMAHTRLAAAGVSLPVGNSRGEWLSNARLRWDGRAVLDGLDSRVADEDKPSD